MNRQKQKGTRAEYLIRDIHLKHGIKAERVPMSGAMKNNERLDNTADVDTYLDGQDEAPFIAEVKSRKDNSGWKIVKEWLGENDILFIKEDRQKFLAVIPQDTYECLLEIIAYAHKSGWKK